MSVLRTFVVILGSLSASYTHAQSHSSDLLGSCRQAFAPLVAQVPEVEKVSPAVAAVIRLITDNSVCNCTVEKLRALGVSALENSEQSALQFLRASIDCQMDNLHREFPPRCPQIYQKLLPAMGYGDPSDGLIRQACSCATDAMATHATANAVYESRVQMLKRGIAQESDRRTGQRTADLIPMPSDPLAVALAETKTCLTRVAGPR